MAGQDHGDDGIDEALAGVMHVALTAAGRLGEQLARQREARLREAQASSEQAGRELQNRFNAEREAARAVVAPVYHEQWWDTAEPAEIERVYETARAWADHDPEAVRAEHAVTAQVKDRYGIDLTREAGDGRSVAKKIAEVEPLRTKRTAQAGADERRGAALLLGADAVDRAAERPAAVEARPFGGYEREGKVSAPQSPGRGVDMGGTPCGSVDAIAVETRVLADHSQAKPATEATRETTASTLLGRNRRMAQQQTRTVERTGRTR